MLLKLQGGKRTEFAKGQITLPGGVSVNPIGTGLYVTDFQLVPQAGRLRKINLRARPESPDGRRGRVCGDVPRSGHVTASAAKVEEKGFRI